VITCTAPDYSGPLTLTVDDPTIASVQQSIDQDFTHFIVKGLKAGTTTLLLQSKIGGTGFVTITVSP
jgi:hypothetical protein